MDTEVVWGKVVSVQKCITEGRMTGDVNLLPKPPRDDVPTKVNTAVELRQSVLYLTQRTIPLLSVSDILGVPDLLTSSPIGTV